jgi:hypothetical protein
MAFKVKGTRTNFKRLESTLLQADAQTKNNPLYQVIKQLLDLSAREEEKNSTSISNLESIVSNTGTGGLLSTLTYVTSGSEVANLPNSRQILAGQYITIDLSTPSEITISSAEWSVLTDGDLIEPELIYAGGDVIMTHIP